MMPSQSARAVRLCPDESGACLHPANVNPGKDPLRIARRCFSIKTLLAGIFFPWSLASSLQGQVTVDPATPMTANWAAEWNTAGNAEGWVGSNATVSVAGGSLSGTATTTDSRVSVSNFASGPDLDLGFNDFIELRVQVPAAYTGNIQIFYGTTGYTVGNGSGGTVAAATTGFSASRVITVPSASIPKDGAFHTYRVEVGLEPAWRATLRDLRIDAVDGAGTSGMAFAIDYIRIGDEPGAAVYQPRYTTECPAAGGTTPAGAPFGGGQTVSSMESKHFRFLWNPAVAAQGAWTADMAHGTLRNLEECWQVYVKKLGYREPCHTIGTTSGTRYKLNVTSWHSGYWAGPDDYSGTSFARLNITPDGLRVDPPSWVITHELMHCFQFHNTTGNVPGEWFEFHANYGQERWLQHYQYFYPNGSGIDPTHVRSGHLNIGDGREYYLCWPFFQYIDENPDGLPDLGEGKGVALWQQTQANEYPFMALERLTPTTSLKDIVGYFARRGATYNYSSKTAINAALASFGQPLDNAATARWQFTDLVQRPDDSSWWRVPFEMAPMQGAYAIHELVPAGSGAGRVVTVNLRGLADSARGADWRASFIVISDTGAERYSSLWGGGNNSVTLAANENKVYLSVAGAPATFYYGGADEAAYPYRTHPSKTRFPYEIQVTGATPKQRDNGGTSGLTQHSNGGGWRSVSVPASVYIGPNARVLGGTVSGNARIEDYAVVTAGTVNTNAVIGGHAWVRGGTVTGNAKVRDWALVEGGTVSGNARILEHGNFKGGTATDLATVKGSAGTLTGNLTGNAIIDGNYGDFFSGRDIANGIAFGHQPYVGVPDHWIKPLPTGLYAAYSFAAAHDSRILDKYGVTDGFTTGSPAWVAADAKRSGFLSFDGSNQSVTLDRSVADLRDFTFTAWVKPLGGAVNQAVLWLGATSTKRLSFTPDDGTGKAKFALVNGGAEQTLTAASPLPVGVWSHVAVTLDSATSTGVLYLNGTVAASGTITIRPDQLLAGNTATALQHNYLARAEGSLMPKFNGALDEVQFYGSALAAADIAAMQPATSPVASGTLYVDLRASDASAGTATWTNNGTIGNFARTGTASKVANVASTGIPGVQFNGTSDAYTGANTVADIDGAGDRTIEVWAYNPALAAEETTVSWGHRWADRRDMAFNFGNNGSWGAVTHWGDDLGWGTAPTANAWHHLVYTYDGGTTAKVYIDGVLANTKTLAGALDTFPGEPLNIGCQREAANGTRSLFYSGYINSVRVHGGVLTASQIAANQSIGPVGAPANAAPTLSDIANQSTTENTATGAIAFTIGDADTSTSVLTVSGSSSNPALVPASNLVFGGSGANRALAITPAAGQSGAATITVTVGDGASTASDTFVLTVNPATVPVITSSGSAAGVLDSAFNYQITATSGPTSFGASGLPAGLSVNTGNGLISGTPTANGTFNATVTATNALGTGNAPLTITIQIPVPPAPIGLTATPGDMQVALNWTAGSGVTGYNVKRATVIGGPYTVIASPTTASFVDPTVVNGTTYYYVVSAINSYGESVDSTEAWALPAVRPPFAHWKFDETTGTTAADASGNGKQGTLVNGSLWATGAIGNAVDLDGTDDYVTAPAGLVSGLTNFTVATWVNLDAVSTWSRIFDFGSGTGTYMFLTPNSGSSTRFAIKAGGAEQQINGPALTVGGWRHVAVTQEGGVGILYIDGVEVGRNSAMTLSPASLGVTTQNWIGRSQWPDPYLNGRVDDFRVYASALPATEVASLANLNNTAPTISTIADQTVALDTPTNPIGFTLGDAETAAGSLTLSVSSANQTLVPNANIVLGGSGANRTVTLTPATGQSGTTAITLSASDGASSTSRTFALTVAAVPVITSSGTASGLLGSAFSYQIAASHSPAGFDASGLPAGLSVDTVSGLISGTPTEAGTFNATISATNGSGTGNAPLSITIQVPAPAAPTGLAATPGNTQVALSWNASEGATTYNVKRATVSGGSYVTVGEAVASTSFTDTGLTNSTAYYYVVSAVNSGGESPNSTEVGATPFNALPSPWLTGDVGAVGMAGTSSDSAGTYTLTGSGADIWGTTDAFQYASQTLTGDGEIRARVTSQTNTDPWAKAGVMIRDGSGTGAVNAFVAVTPGNGFTFQSRATAGGSTVLTAGPALNATPNNWLRLTRSGGLFTAYVSADGTAWTQIGSYTLTVGGSVSVGLAVTSHNNAAVSTATFDNVSVTPFPSPWVTADIGTTGLTGSAEFYGTAYTVKGAGTFGGTVDGFRYVYQPLSADGSIVARVSTLGSTGNNARVGIMMRDTLGNNARMAALTVTGSGAYKWERRTVTAGSVTTTNSNSGTAPNIWIRLVRAGNVVTASKSANGTSWTTIGSATVTMASNCYIGLAVASGSTTTLNVSAFDNLTVVP